MDTAVELAATALSQATVAPDRARLLAGDAIRLSLQSQSWVSASVASRALGLALLQLRDTEASATAMRASVKYARRADRRDLVGEARMSLAATMCVRGLASRAVSEIERALADLQGVAAARGLVQRAAVLADLGRLDDSLADLRKALPVLRQVGDAPWQVRALSNRSLVFIARRAFSAAEDDLLTAQGLCVENDLGLPRAYVEHNLGFLAASRRQVVPALKHFDLADAAFRRFGMKVGSLYSDRGELLLSVRLLGEARSAAEAAIEAHRSQGRHLELPEAQLLLSTVALVQGDPTSAAAAADHAIRGYRRLRRADGLALARHARLQAQAALDPQSVTPAMARKSADDLASVGWLVPALEARVAAGLLALQRGRRAEAKRDLAAAGRARFSGPADARARAWLAEALLRRADGRRRAAKAAVSAGLRVVENYQATLGATELRAHVSLQRGSLAVLGLRMAVEDADPRRVLSFVERGRASALLRRSARPPEDPVLAGHLADLRTTMLEIEERRMQGRSAAELIRRQVALEGAVAADSRRTPAIDAVRTQPRSVSEVADVLGDAALVEYVQLDEKLYAVTLVDGRTRLRVLGSIATLGQDLAQMAFTLRRMADPRSSVAGVGAATALLNRLRVAIDDLLLRPLAADLGDRPMVVVPVGVLQTLPWSVLPSCSGRPVTVSPSATLWHNAAVQAAVPTGSAVVAIAGPGLRNAVDEAAAVADIHPGATVLSGREASVAAVSAAMDGAALVHVASHGRLRSDNPLFSALVMSDGPLTVYDLERLRTAPRHVVLAACGAAGSHSVGSDEVLGLAAALLAQGATALVAPVISVVDSATVPLMRLYHAELRSGRAPADALALTQEKAAATGPVAWATAAPFISLGAGHAEVIPGPNREMCI